MKRRAYLATATVTAIAGCMGVGDDPEDDGLDSADESDDLETGDDSDESMDDSEESVDDEDEGEGESEEEGEPTESESFDDFSDLSAWEATAGSLTADEDRTDAGSQSALLEASEDEERVRIVRELSDPVDCTGMQPGVTVTAGHMVDLEIQLLDDDGDRIDFRQGIEGGLPFVQTNFGIDVVDGDPDLSEVTQIQIGFWAGDETEAEVWVDDLYFVSRPEQGRVMIQFDGGYETAYTEGLGILEEHEYPATTFVATGRIREESDHEGDRLTEAQLEDLDDAGWTIGSYAAHGLDLTEMSAEEQEEELRDAAEWLESEGYNDVSCLAYPGGRYDETTLDLATEYYDLAFAGRYPAQGDVVNPYLCSRVNDPSAEDAIRMLDLTAEWGGTTSLVYFQLEESISELEEAIDHLASLESDGELEVIVPDDVTV